LNHISDYKIIVVGQIHEFALMGGNLISIGKSQEKEDEAHHYRNNIVLSRGYFFTLNNNHIQ